jgi:hypothetical protein
MKLLAKYVKKAVVYNMCVVWMCMCRSSVFEAMFAHDNTKESVERTVIVSDAKPDAVQCMLDYVYTDIFHSCSTELAWGILHLANKYNMVALQVF